MSRLQQLRIVDAVLTNLAAGYINDEFIADSILPRVPVTKEGGKVPLFGKAQFIEHRTERAIRGATNVRDPEGVKTIDYVLTEYDIATRLDYREKQEADFQIDAVETANTMEILRLGHELRVARMVQNPATYVPGNTITLAGADQFTNPASDPLGVVLDAKAAVRSQIVREPNTLWMGYSTYLTLLRHPQLVGLLSTNKDRILTDDELQSRLATLPLQRHTAHTATDLPTLLERIRQARTQGWCLVNQELEEGLISIAAPLTNRLGQTVAALNISGQANRTSAEVMQATMLPALLKAARTISRLLSLQRN